MWILSYVCHFLRGNKKTKTFTNFFKIEKYNWLLLLKIVNKEEVEGGCWCVPHKGHLLGSGEFIWLIDLVNTDYKLSQVNQCKHTSIFYSLFFDAEQTYTSTLHISWRICQKYWHGTHKMASWSISSQWYFLLRRHFLSFARSISFILRVWREMDMHAKDTHDILFKLSMMNSLV
jgi:hypothetical protein